MAPEQHRGVQNINAVSGVAYGVIGADLHIFGDGTPVYLLHRWNPPVRPEAAWLQQSPSRMLNARHEVVPFIGRESERDELHRWRQHGARLSARWLHGPGGQGKTRLASVFAQESESDGWLVVRAVHGLGTVLPAQRAENLDPDGRTGVLLIVDYADRWPLSHLTWLFSNALLHRPDLPARILLLARSADAWPATRAALANHHADHSSMLLGSLPDEPQARGEMYEAAVDAFADIVGIRRPAALATVAQLTNPDMGLTLALHMAALVAVDTVRSGRAAPTDLAGLTAYLVDREHLHWTNLASHRSPLIRTPPETMHRLVFLAALSGAMPRVVGEEVARNLFPEVQSEVLLSDHAICYPTDDESTVLEPLYPDRLAEDFIALTLPGHSADYPAAPWSPELSSNLFRSLRAIQGLSPTRAVTFLSAAAERWPHVGPGHLYPWLRADPELLLAAGSQAMAAVSQLPDLDIDVLHGVDPLLPTERHVDLDVGAAAVTVRLTERRLGLERRPGFRGRIQGLKGWRLAHVGRYEEALEATRAAATEYRQAVIDEPEIYEPLLAAAMNNVCHFLSELGLQHEAVDAAVESLALRRRLAGDDPDQQSKLALALNTYALLLSELGEATAALEPATEALEIRRRLAAQDVSRLDELASSLTNVGLIHDRLGDLEEALEPIAQATQIYRDLVEIDAARYLPDLAAALNNLGGRLSQLDRHAEALPVLEEGVALRRKLVRDNEIAFLPLLAAVLNNYGNVLAKSSRLSDALACTQEAAGIFRTLSRVRPEAYLHALARVSLNIGNRLSESGRREEARASYDETLRARRRLVAVNPAAHVEDLAWALVAVAKFRAMDLSELPAAMAAAQEAITLLAESGTNTAGEVRTRDLACQVVEQVAGLIAEQSA